MRPRPARLVALAVVLFGPSPTPQDTPLRGLPPSGAAAWGPPPGRTVKPTTRQRPLAAVVDLVDGGAADRLASGERGLVQRDEHARLRLPYARVALRSHELALLRARSSRSARSSPRPGAWPPARGCSGPRPARSAAPTTRCRSRASSCGPPARSGRRARPAGRLPVCRGTGLALRSPGSAGAAGRCGVARSLPASAAMIAAPIAIRARRASGVGLLRIGLSGC